MAREEHVGESWVTSGEWWNRVLGRRAAAASITGASRHAREAAGERDIRIAGGANTIMQYLNAGLIDQFSLALAPVFFGGGTRLFDGIDRQKIGLEIQEAVHSPLVTHLRYAVARK